jgi:hypothetical protein
MAETVPVARVRGAPTRHPVARQQQQPHASNSSRTPATAAARQQQQPHANNSDGTLLLR